MRNVFIKYSKYKGSSVKVSTIKQISMQQWPNVKVLTLGSSEHSCNINAEGCFYMSQANWPLLEELNLRKKLTIQAIPIWGMKAASLSAKPIGHDSDA